MTLVKIAIEFNFLPSLQTDMLAPILAPVQCWNWAPRAGTGTPTSPYWHFVFLCQYGAPSAGTGHKREVVVRPVPELDVQCQHWA